MRSGLQNFQHVAQQEKYYLWQARMSYLHTIHEPETHTPYAVKPKKEASSSFCFLWMVASGARAFVMRGFSQGKGGSS